ncbi:MAG: transglutaminase family protein [Planctomycetota bacterium]|jgi:regulator of sirC expression with transglutaminase-like and TPR domain
MHPREPKYCNSRALDFFRESISGLDTPAGLFSAAVAIALHFQPNESPRSSIESILDMSDTVRNRVRRAAPEALVAHLHEVMFEELAFTGNEADYYAIENSLMPSVLRTKRGIPITLSLIYYTVGRMVGLEVEGVNSPGHFLIRVHLGRDTMLVDPFHAGRVLSAVEGVAMIERVVQHPWQDDVDWFPRCSPHQWLERILNNLRSTLIHTGDYKDVAAMRELQSVLNEAAP